MTYLDILAVFILLTLAVWLSSGFVRKIHEGVYWRLFWYWVAFDWCGYYGLSAMAALKILKHSAPYVRARWLRRRSPTALVLKVIEPIGKPLIKITHNQVSGGCMRNSILILTLVLLTACGSAQPKPDYALNYNAPITSSAPSRSAEQVEADQNRPFWNCQPWQVMDSGGKCFDVNN